MKIVRGIAVCIGIFLLFGGVGYSEMPGGNFWMGIGEACVGLIILFSTQL